MATIVKGEARGKPGRWICDYRDSFGKRRWKVFRSKRQAEDFLAQALRESRQPARPAVDPDITVAAYADRWLTTLTGLKPASVKTAHNTLRVHVLPVFGPFKVRQLTRALIKEFLARKLQVGYAKNLVGVLLGGLRAMLSAAVEDGVLLANPAYRLGRALRLLTPPSARPDEIKAMTRAQLATFLEACRSHGDPYVRRHFPFFLLLARCGVRLGEALALTWADVDRTSRALRVRQAFSAGRLQTTKTGGSRTVDLSQQTGDVLARLETKHRTETLRRGWPEVPPWLFVNQAGQPLDDRKVRKVFARVLKAAGLPPHFSPHSLRHTFASLLLQAGESPVYVQRQLGHASIKMTVDTYGKWLPMGNPAAVDRLDDPARPGMNSVASAGPALAATGSQTVANTVAKAAAGGGGVVQAVDFARVGRRTRPRDPVLGQ